MKPMILNEGQEFDCSNCTGACCRKLTLIHLSPEEHRYLEDADAVLREIDEESMPGLRLMGGAAMDSFVNSVPAGHQTYGFLQDCPFLDTASAEGWPQCTIFDDPNRPEACGKFRVGSVACHDAREQWAVFESLRNNRGEE